MQELRTNQEAVMTDFDDEGFSATVKFTSPDADGGSMTTYLVRGMVSRWRALGGKRTACSISYCVCEVGVFGQNEEDHRAVTLLLW